MIALFVIAGLLILGLIIFKAPWRPGVKPTDFVEVRQGDITKMGFKCIVNAANRFGLGGGGVDGAIHRAAGAQLKQWIRDNVPCWEVQGDKDLEFIRITPGGTIVTPGFNLCKTIIHTVGPIWEPQERQGCEEILTLAYRNSITDAKAEGYDEVAFPLISTGIYGYPLQEAIDHAIMTCAIHGYLEGVTSVLVAYDEPTFTLLQERLNHFKEII